MGYFLQLALQSLSGSSDGATVTVYICTNIKNKFAKVVVTW